MTGKLDYLKSKDTDICREEMLAEVLASKRDGVLTERLGELIIELVEGISRQHRWSGYTDIEDYKGDAIIVLMDATMKFNPDISDNPMSYFTTCVTRCMDSRVKSDRKKHWEFKQRLSDSIELQIEEEMRCQE